MQFLKQTNQLNGTVVFTGPHFSMEEAEKIVDSVWERNEKLLSEWWELANNNTVPLPTMPLRVLPSVTTYCVSGRNCYHVRHWTADTSESRWMWSMACYFIFFSRSSFSFFILAAALHQIIRISYPLRCCKCSPLDYQALSLILLIFMGRFLFVMAGSHSAIIYLGAQEMIQPWFLR